MDTSAPIEELLRAKPTSAAVRARLVAEFDRLLWRLAYRMERRADGRAWGQAEDFHAEGALALLDAAERYDPTRGAKFLTWAHRCVWGRLRKLLRPAAARARHGLAFVPYPVDDDGAPLEPMAPEPDARPLPDELEALEKALAELPLRARHVVDLRFGRGSDPRPQAEVAATLGVCPATVGAIERRALRDLRRLLSA